MSRIELNGVSKNFGKITAVSDFTANIEEGEFVTFLGPSGCGKTTSLRLIAGFIEPSSGSVSIGELVVSDPERKIFVPVERRNVGMVFQSYAVWPHMNVLDNVAYPLKIKKVPRSERLSQVEEVLELVKMPELIDRFPHELSGGQQQRVALARALVMEPEVLLLDEPLSNLDAKLREEMRIELKELQRKTGITIVFVTHDQLEAMVLSDRVVVMNRGKVHQIGVPKEIYKHPSDRFVADFIGAANFLEVERRPEGVAPTALPDVTIPLNPPDSITAQRLTLMVRPEEVRLSRREGQLQTKVNEKMYIGDAVLYILSCRDQVLKAKVPSSEDYEPGQKLYVSFLEGSFLA